LDFFQLTALAIQKLYNLLDLLDLELILVDMLAIGILAK